MRSESMRLCRGVSDGSRQPPTCTAQIRRITFYTGHFRLLTSDNRKFSYPFALRHKLGALVVHGTSGKDSQTSQRVFTEDDSDDQQSSDVGSWWQATQQTDGAEPQIEHRHRQNEQALPHLNRNITALSKGPRLSLFHRSLESNPPIGPSTATNAPIRNRVLAAAAAGGGGGNDADPASTSHVLLPNPTAAPLPPVGSTSPHSRAFSFLSTAVSLLAVGAYVYTIVKRRQASGDAAAGSGSMSQGPVAAPAPPAPRPPKKIGAGSGLFRPANAAGTTPANAAAKDAANAAALGQLPAAAAAAAAGVVVRTDAGAAQALRQAAVVAGPEQPPASPSRERGWWRRLARVYYISFGAQYGLVPRVRLDGTAGTLGSGTATSSAGGGSGGAVLAAFEDAADAEYVANALWEDLVQNGAQPSGPRPSTMGVLSAAPIFLEDLAAMRGAPVEVVPADGLRKDVQLSTAQLEVVLAALVRGASPEAAAAQAERVLDEAAAAAAAAAADATSESPSDAALDGGGGGGLATATTAAARGRAGAGPAMVRNPLERTAEQHGVKIKLPSKFDFPGFDADGASKPTAVSSSALRPAPPVSDGPMIEAVSRVAAAPPPPPANSFSAPSTDSLSTPPPPPPPPSGKAPAAAVAATTLPLVTPSAVQEPARGVRGGAAEDDLQSDVWMPYGGERIIDMEAVEVSPTLASAAAAAAVTATAVPSREAYEAMREYQELETLLMMATNTNGGGGGAAAAAAAAAVAPDRRDVSWQVIAADSRRDAASSTLTDPAAASLSPIMSEEEDQWLQPSLQPSRQLQPQQGREEIAQVKRKSGPERAAEIIAQKGPTDVAVEAALAALGDAGDEQAEEDIFDEYYSIFNSSDRQEEDSPSSSNGSSNGSSSGNRSNGNSGSSSDLAAEVAEVQRQLAGVVQAVAAAHASGSPPPADAATTMQRLQQQLHNLQGRLTAASPAATMPASVTVTPATSRSTAAAAAAAGATATSSRQSGGLFSAALPLRAAGKAAGAGGGGGGGNNNVNSGGGGASAPSAPAATTMNPDPATLVTPLSPAGGGATAAKADARRAWGAWKTNRRVQEAEATLLKAATRAATLPPAERAAAPLPPPPRGAPTAPPAMAAGDGGSSTSGGSGADSEGVVVLSKRVGGNRPPKVVEAPEVRQDRVKEALRVFSEMGSDMGQEEEDDEQLFGRSASLLAGGRKPWWQQRFQALFLPTIGYPDGSMGFLQVNVSLSGDRRDMRVLAFEDRSDCTACLTLMAQWPEHEGAEPRMSMMPTEKLLQQLQDIYDEQADVNSGVSRPRGLAVFRRSKLPMRPGMGPDDFIQAVVYQHAAQVALARTGYGFNS